jgi:hypothetical protein
MSRTGPSWGSPSPLKKETLGEPPYSICSTCPWNICARWHLTVSTVQQPSPSTLTDPTRQRRRHAAARSARGASRRPA